MSEQLKAHREYLEGCEKRALSKLQATRAVVKAAREVCAVPCSCEEAFTARGLHASQCLWAELSDLRDALAKLDEAE